MRFLIALAFLPLCASVAAQGMYKCKNPAGKITYSGKECNLMGLTDAGEVKGKASVTSAQEQPPGMARQPAKPAAAAASKAPETASQGQAAAKAEDEKDKDRRCFVVKTAKGNVTRCNDTPEEAPAGK